jgi:RNA polymerase sigma-70 factor (ECF subfamily)
MFKSVNDSEDWELSSDQQLWEAFVDGNREAFSVFFIRFYERLFRYGMNFLSGKKEEAVKDGIQKLFFRLWKKRQSLQVPNSIDGYLYVSLRRILLRKVRRKKARNDRNSTYIEEEYDYIFNIEELMILREERKKRKALLQKALESLTPRQKEALLLRIDSGMSNKEISAIMEISDKRVRNLIYAATKRLKKKITELLEMDTDHTDDIEAGDR